MAVSRDDVAIGGEEMARSRRRRRCGMWRSVVLGVVGVGAYFGAIFALWGRLDALPSPPAPPREAPPAASPQRPAFADVQNMSLAAALDRRARNEAAERERRSSQSVAFVIGVEHSGHAGCAEVLGRVARQSAPMASSVYSKHGVMELTQKSWLPRRGPETPILVARVDDAELVPDHLLGQVLATAASRGGRVGRVVAVLRHPLPWAVRVVQRWAERTRQNATNRTVSEHVERWRRATDVYLEVPGLEIVHVEAFDMRTVRRLFPGDLVKSNVNIELPSVSVNVGLVRCWLRGTDFVDFVSVCEYGETVETEDRSYFPPRAADRHLEFWFVKRHHECAIERYGYTLRSFENLLACGRSCARSVRESRLFPPFFEEFLAPEIAAKVVVKLPDEDNKVTSQNMGGEDASEDNKDASSSFSSQSVVAAGDGKHGDVIVAFFKIYNYVRSSGARGGMFARMAQVVHALDQAGFRVHFVCHCSMGPVREVDKSWAPKNVRFYEGDTNQQLDQLLPYSCGGRSSIRALFLFVTSLTVDMHFRAAVKRVRFWWKEPRLGTIASEEIARRVSEHSPNVKRVVLTDDIHSIRARQAFSDIKEPVHIEFMLSWLKRREFAIYEAADYVLTVSSEDADLVETELELARPDVDSKRYKKQLPSVVWAPFVQTSAAQEDQQQQQQPKSSRDDEQWTLAKRAGLLYVGMPHPVAVPSVKWLVRHVLPKLRERLREMGKPEEFVAKQAVLYLGGGGENARRWYHAVKKVPGSNSTVKLIGQLSDVAFEKHLTRWRRVLAAPLFNNTGVATKIITGLAHGIPVVTTSGGCRGLGLPQEGYAHILRVADDVPSFVEETARLLTDDYLWYQLAENGRHHVEETLSSKALIKTVHDAVVEHDDDPATVSVPAREAFARYVPTSPRLYNFSNDDKMFPGETNNTAPPSLARSRGAWFAARRAGEAIAVVRLGASSFDEIAPPIRVPAIVGTACPSTAASKHRRRKKKKKVDVLPVDEVKLFEWRDELWVLFVAPPRCLGSCDLCAYEVLHYLVRVDGASPAKPVVVRGAPLGSNQRGFVPWVLDDELYLSVMIEPHVVLKCDVGNVVVSAALEAVSTNDALWRDIRALDGGCLTRPAIFPTSPAIRWPDGSFFGIARTHVELGCLRFHEHLAYSFEPTFPFRVVRRSPFVPLNARAFAPATVNECRTADATRVRSGKAKAAAGLALDHRGDIRISYASATGARVFTLPNDRIFDNGTDDFIKPAPCPPPDDIDEPPECVVIRKHAADCIQSRKTLLTKRTKSSSQRRRRRRRRRR
ncbi:hypothetical protein CTAYLR_004414 [Chrysophaeum taylorii]|uniref:Glycosyltransferase n=1 Tax=Chrysophaeum taylorii TaxID=2483200 RepID=A0AAD7UM05_9STRA|nr:hypothetical protein CTAYLR_004414 [Chrysophaeum taylorii]